MFRQSIQQLLIFSLMGFSIQAYAVIPKEKIIQKCPKPASLHYSFQSKYDQNLIIFSAYNPEGRYFSQTKSSPISNTNIELKADATIQDAYYDRDFHTLHCTYKLYEYNEGKIVGDWYPTLQNSEYYPEDF